jgi:hypothetical protein
MQSEKLISSYNNSYNEILPYIIKIQETSLGPKAQHLLEAIIGNTTCNFSVFYLKLFEHCRTCCVFLNNHNS